MRWISPHFAYAGRTYPVSGLPHLLRLIIANMANARLARLSVSHLYIALPIREHSIISSKAPRLILVERV